MPMRPSSSSRRMVRSERTTPVQSISSAAMATTKTIDIRTDLPGPRSREILARKERVVADPLSIYLPLVIAEAHGATFTDVDGNTFLDFAGGVGCMNVGHSNPRV